MDPSAGTVRLFGEAPDRFHARWRLGFVPQRPSLESEVPATVREIVSSGRLRQRGWWRRQSDADVAAIDHAIGSVGLAEVADLPLNELSVGQQQRAFIARAFASEPDLLVLDEPIAGVDRASQRRFRESLVHLQREHGAGVLLVSHELSAVADVIDRVIVLKRRGAVRRLAGGAGVVGRLARDPRGRPAVVAGGVAVIAALASALARHRRVPAGARSPASRSAPSRRRSARSSCRSGCR